VGTTAFSLNVNLLLGGMRFSRREPRPPPDQESGTSSHGCHDTRHDWNVLAVPLGCQTDLGKRSELRPVAKGQFGIE